MDYSQASRRRRQDEIRRRRGMPAVATQLQQANRQLQQLADIEMTQIRSSIPDVRDPPVMKLKRDKVYTFKRSFNLPNIAVVLVGIDVTSAYTFALNSVPDVADFTALFDQYRIPQIAVKFIPAGVTNSATGGGTLLTAVDQDDNTILSAAALYQYDSLIQTQSGQYVERVFTPKAALAAYSGAFTSYALSSPNQWFDCASPSINYYGLKSVHTQNSTSTLAVGTVLYNVVATMTLQFRHPR